MKSRDIAGGTVLVALSILMEILPLDLPFPLFEKLTIDPTGIPLVLALFIYGPISSIAATIITAFVIALPRPPFKPPNPIGAFFKGLAELATLCGVIVYLKIFKKKSFLIASVFGILFRVVIMCIANYVFLPIFYGLPTSVAVSFIPIIIVFNIVQGAINLYVAYYLFKAVKRSYPFKSYW